MWPTYYESAEGIEIDKPRVIRELERHGCGPADIAEFFDEVKGGDLIDGDGKSQVWDAQDVLRWLHY